MISVAEARSRFDPVPGYLNAASLGLPTREVVESMTLAVGNWRRGEASPAAYDQTVTQARCLYADLAGVPADRVAVGSQRAQTRSILAERRPLGERIRQISAWFFGSPQEAGDWSLLFAELWLLAMREPGLRPRMQQIHTWSRQSLAAMIDQETQKLGVTLIVPAGDLAEAVLALGNGPMMQHLLAPSERTPQTYRSALRAMFRAAARSSGEEGLS